MLISTLGAQWARSDVRDPDTGEDMITITVSFGGARVLCWDIPDPGFWCNDPDVLLEELVALKLRQLWHGDEPD